MGTMDVAVEQSLSDAKEAKLWSNDNLAFACVVTFWRGRGRGGGAFRGSRGRGRGRGRQSQRGEDKSVEDLDAELETYHAEAMQTN